MFRLIFGLLGLMIALAVVSSLMKNQLGALRQIGDFGATATTRVHKPDGSAPAVDAGAGSMAGRAVGGARLDAFGATAGAEIPTPQQQVQGAQKSVFDRTDQAWKQSEQRYRRADP